MTNHHPSYFEVPIKEVEKRINDLTFEKEETINNYIGAHSNEQDILSERNIRISFELKFLNELLSTFRNPVPLPEGKTAQEILDSKFVNGMTNNWKMETREKILEAMEEYKNQPSPLLCKTEKKQPCDRCEGKPESPNNILCNDCESDLHGM
jgi:hypothetical protein